MIDQIGFLSSFKFLRLDLTLKICKLMVVLTLKILHFEINNGLLKSASIFFFIWPTCSLVSAKKVCFFFLLIKHLKSIAVLRLKL